jgi:hypothetical protein
MDETNIELVSTDIVEQTPLATQIPIPSVSSINPMLIKLDELVAYISDIQGIEKITPMNIIIIVDNLVQIVEKYGDLTGLQKKMLVLDAIKKIVNYSSNLNQNERATLIVIIDLTIPHVIDTIITAINGDMKFEKDKTKQSCLSKLFHGLFCSCKKQPNSPQITMI